MIYEFFFKKIFVLVYTGIYRTPFKFKKENDNSDQTPNHICTKIIYITASSYKYSNL